MRYVVVLERTENNRGAYFPDIPGCVAVGDTREEVERSIQEALEFHREGMRDAGEPVPAPGAWTTAVEVEIPAGALLEAS